MLEGLSMGCVGIFYGHLDYFETIWSILRAICIFYGHLLYFVAIWFPIFPFWYVVAREIWQPWAVSEARFICASVMCDDQSASFETQFFSIERCTFIRTYIHTYIHMYIHTYIHTWYVQHFVPPYCSRSDGRLFEYRREFNEIHSHVSFSRIYNFGIAENKNVFIKIVGSNPTGIMDLRSNTL
jgi:hypothetical protein